MGASLDLVFDVGLHKGEDTAFYLRKGYRVVGFEANPSLVQFCRDRFAEEIASGRLHIVDGAIAPQTDTGKVTFYINERSVWGTINTDWVSRNERMGTSSHAIEVSRVDIASALLKYGIPFYLKIDIEGADILVLKALHEIRGRPEFVSIEIQSLSDRDASRSLIARDVYELCALGYARFQLVPQATIAGSQIKTTTLRGDPFEYTFPVDASGRFGDDLQGQWVDRDELLKAFREEFKGWQDIHARL